MTPSDEPGIRSVAVVLAGAGARGAYEAGVMSVVLPHLDGAGLTPDLYVGTSAGAINATVLASAAHLPPPEQATALLTMWRGIANVEKNASTTFPHHLFYRRIKTAKNVFWYILTRECPHRR